MMTPSSGGLRVPGWFIATLTAIATIVGLTITVLNDRATFHEQLNRIQRNQCVVLAYLATRDARFALPIFREGCP